jgi:large subunit ribosomal protein L35
MPRKNKPGKKYKLKTHKSTSKRFKITGTGKLMRTKGRKSHFRRRKSTRTKRLFDQMVVVEGKGYQKRIHRLAPYIKKYKTGPTARTAK